MAVGIKEVNQTRVGGTPTREGQVISGSSTPLALKDLVICSLHGFSTPRQDSLPKGSTIFPN